jgi:aspartyl-tRNA(Asn)/glutamyl-tRNA(Gln) amidotransferase subunit A
VAEVTELQPTAWTLGTLSEALRKREISPVEITRACLDRIEQYDGATNAVLTVLADRALTQAARAEAEILNGDYRGPLHGVPYAAKDLFLTKGIRTTCGSRILSSFVPDHDAAVIERLDRAGAILLGKLNMHEFAFGTTSVNPHFGAVRNPWNYGRVTGGSSGGSAAAVAASFAFLTLGSDTGGSIRIPAALCGVCGFKPTYGRISRYGAYPLAWSMDHIGPFAHRVRDLAVAMNVIAGWDGRDPSSAKVPVPDYCGALTGTLDGVRIGIPDALFFEHLDGEVRLGVERALSVFARAGATVRPVSIDLLPDAARAASIILFAEASAVLDKWQRTRPEALGSDVRARLESAGEVKAADYLKALRIRRKVERTFEEVFREIDVLVTPQVPITAPPIEATTVDIGGRVEPVPAALTRFTRIFNLTGMPALLVGCGLSSDRLPIALQIVGRPLDDATVLRIGDGFERLGAVPERPILRAAAVQP